jgi:hypothetical protein
MQWLRAGLRSALLRYAGRECFEAKKLEKG